MCAACLGRKILSGQGTPPQPFLRTFCGEDLHLVLWKARSGHGVSMIGGTERVTCLLRENTSSHISFQLVSTGRDCVVPGGQVVLCEGCQLQVD